MRPENTATPTGQGNHDSVFRKWTYVLLTGDADVGSLTVAPEPDDVLHTFVSRAWLQQDSWPDDRRLAFCARLRNILTAATSGRREGGAPGAPRRSDILAIVIQRLLEDGHEPDDAVSRVAQAFNIAPNTVRKYHRAVIRAREARTQGLLSYPRIAAVWETSPELGGGDDASNDKSMWIADHTIRPPSVGGYDARLAAKIDAVRDGRSFTTASLEDGLRMLRASAALNGRAMVWEHRDHVVGGEPKDAPSD
jgi:hypothetical protein